jgi:hypothetical protein
MILPSKNLDLNNSPLLISSKLLQNHRGHKVKFEVLQNEVRNIVGDCYWIILLRSINFLFLAGVVDYDNNTDSLEFLDGNSRA